MTSFDFVQSALDKPLEFHYKVSASDYAKHAGPLLLVRPRVVGSFALPFDDRPRHIPIDLNATGRWHDSYDIRLPEGYVVDETPDPVDLDLAFASYHSKVTAQGDQIHYERAYEVRKVEIPASDAEEFLKLESAILSDERSTAVLKKR